MAGSTLNRLRSAGTTLLPLRRLSRRGIVDFQSARLRALVHHAWSNVPLYRARLDAAGVRPEHIQSVDDLARLPIVSRADLQQAAIADRLARGVDAAALIARTTSGSSGVPLAILRTSAEDALLQAVRLRELFRLGLRPWHLRVSVDRAHGRDAVTFDMRPLRMRMGLLRRYSVDCFGSPDSVCASIARMRPDVIEGFAGSLARAAAHLRDSGHVVRPRFLVAGAETLSPAMRSVILDGFSAPIYDFYGSHECNLISAECAVSGRHHLMETSVIAEVLNGDRPAQPFESGELVVTALHSFAMPFIRYRLGDIVTPGECPCPCGAPVRTLVSVQGRQIEMFVQPSGQLFHPYPLVERLLALAPWLSQYQLVQQRRDWITVKIRPRSGTSITAQDRQRISLGFADLLEAGVTVDVVEVAEIAPEANGKLRPYYTLAT